jgi:hypothetical protein
MARSRGLLNELDRLAENIDRFAVAAFSRGPARAAEEIVVDLQEAGPVWSGKFSNSWQIETSDGRRTAGTGAPGTPRRIPAPLLSGRGFAFDDIKYTISNFSPYADVARDLVESDYIDPGTLPIKEYDRGTRISGYRGDLIGDDEGPNRSTAPLDWYPTYINGGGIDRRIKLELDRELGRIRL